MPILRLFANKQFLNFLIVGASATAVQLILLTAFIELLAIQKVLSSALAYALSSIFNYTLNYSLTFKSSQSHTKTLPRFIGTSVFGLLLNTMSFSLFLIVFNYYLLSQCFATGLTLVSNFLLHKFWIYRKEK